MKYLGSIRTKIFLQAQRSDNAIYIWFKPRIGPKLTRFCINRFLRASVSPMNNVYSKIGFGWV